MRYRKKIEKDESYVNTALKLCSVIIMLMTDEKEKNKLSYLNLIN